VTGNHANKRRLKQGKKEKQETATSAVKTDPLENEQLRSMKKRNNAATCTPRNLVRKFVWLLFLRSPSAAASWAVQFDTAAAVLLTDEGDTRRL
jgi:hypothetical protein